MVLLKILSIAFSFSGLHPLTSSKVCVNSPNLSFIIAMEVYIVHCTLFQIVNVFNKADPLSTMTISLFHGKSVIFASFDVLVKPETSYAQCSSQWIYLQPVQLANKQTL